MGLRGVAKSVYTRVKSLGAKGTDKLSNIQSRPTTVTVKNIPAQTSSIRSVDIQGKQKISYIQKTPSGKYVVVTTTRPTQGYVTYEGKGADAGQVWDIPQSEIIKTYERGVSGGSTSFTQVQQKNEYQIGGLTFSDVQSNAPQRNSWKDVMRAGVRESLVKRNALNFGMYQNVRSTQEAIGFGKFAVSTGEALATIPATFLGGGTFSRSEFESFRTKPFGNVERVTFQGTIPQKIKEYPQTPAVVVGYSKGVVGSLYLGGSQLYGSIKTLGVIQGIVSTASQVLNPIQIAPQTYVYKPALTGIKPVTYFDQTGKFVTVIKTPKEVVGLTGSEIGKFSFTRIQSGTLNVNKAWTQYDIVKAPYISIAQGGDVVGGTLTSITPSYGFVAGIRPTAGIAPLTYEKTGILNKQLFIKENIGGIGKGLLPQTGVQYNVVGTTYTKYPNWFGGKPVLTTSSGGTSWGFASSGEGTTSGTYRFVTGEAFTRFGMSGVGTSRYISREPVIVLTNVPKSTTLGGQFRQYSGGTEASQYFAPQNIYSSKIGLFTTPFISKISPAPSTGTSFFPMVGATTLTRTPTRTITPQTERTEFSYKVSQRYFGSPISIGTTSTITSARTGTSTGVFTATALTNALGTKTITDQITTTVTPTIGIFNPPSIPPFIPFLRGFGGFSTSTRSRKIKGKKARRKYTPSFEALVFGIKGKAPSKITGLEVRPIPKGFKWSYNKLGF